MPKFIIKHGCCYIPPIDNSSSTTCQVYSNPEFNNVVPSDPFCGKGKSSPEFNQERNIISWAHLDYTAGESKKCTKSSEKTLSTTSTSVPNTKENCTQTQMKENKENLITLYGYEKREVKGLTRAMHDDTDTSIYRPTTSKNSDISRSEKMLDRLSACLWKCSAWCQ